jgi:hypothetical protein
MVKSSSSKKPESGRLSPLLEEFQDILQHEINTPKEKPSNDEILLSNGSRVSQRGDSYHYEFLVESVFDTADDIPDVLVISGHPPLEATVVSIEGHQVVISLEKDLGQFIPTAYLQTEVSTTIRNLIERLEHNASAENSTGAQGLTKTISEVSSTSLPDELALYPNQKLALQNTLGRDLTVIWGTSEANKTLNIVTAIEQLYNSGQTVLIVSQMNTAVDRSIKQAAKSLRNCFQQGSLIRVGEVKDDRFKSTYPDILVKQQVESRSLQLTGHKASLILEKEKLSGELQILNKGIITLKWLKSAEPYIQSAKANMEKIHKLESQLALDEKTWAALELLQSDLVRLQNSTSRIMIVRPELTSKREQLNNLTIQLSSVNPEIDHLQSQLQKQKYRLKIAERLLPLRVERAAYPSFEEQKSIVNNLSIQLNRSNLMFDELQRRFNLANRELSQINSTGYLGRIFKNLPKPKDQKAVVNALFMQLTAIKAEVRSNIELCNNSKNKLNRIHDLDLALLGHEDIGSKNVELAKELECEKSLCSLEDQKTKLEGDISALTTAIGELEEEEKILTSAVGEDPEIMNLEARAKLLVSQEMQASILFNRASVKKLREDTNRTLDHLLAQFSEGKTIIERQLSEEQKLDFIFQWSNKSTSQHNPTELPLLDEKADLLRSRISELTDNITTLEEDLSKVEGNIIKSAFIVGTTFTSLYVCDSLQSRRFDTVILDEASIASVLTLWVAALLANYNIIIVKDPK